MENNITNENVKSITGWKVAAICLAAALLLSGGAFTFFAIRNGNEQARLQDTIASQQSFMQDNCPENAIDTPTDTLPDTPNINDQSSNYLTIAAWGVRLVVPYGLENMTYQFDSYSDGESITLAGKLQRGFARGDNKDSDFSSIEAVFIIRSKESSLTTASGTINSNQKVGDYFYFIERTRAGKLPTESAELVREQVVALVLSATHSLALTP